MLEKGADVEICGSLFNRTPLMKAAECGHFKIVEFLINHGASVNATDKYGNTALLLAVRERQNEIFCLVLQNVNDAGLYIVNQRTPLMQVAACGQIEIVEVLINHGASINARDKYGNTALLFAARERQKGIVELLLQKGADVEIPDEDDITPLMEAAECGHVQIVELLINHGASVNAKDKYGCTALSLALANNHNDIVQLLLQHGL